MFAPGNQEAKKKGPNKVSMKVKESIVNFLENNIDKVQDSFDKLKPSGKLKFIAEILPYAAPKLSSVTTENETNISGGITITWEEPKLPTGQSESPTGELPGLPERQEDNS